MSALMKNGGSGMGSGLVVLRDVVAGTVDARKASAASGGFVKAAKSGGLRVVSRNISDVAGE